tara:strand:- start:431 stop:547 length:117 start_codon:yes stop_codon:yes gene_type:complete
MSYYVGFSVTPRVKPDIASTTPGICSKTASTDQKYPPA